MSEQEYCNSGDTFGVRLVNHVDDAVLPVGVHDFADAIGRCMLVDKTMFIADVLDYDASVVVCCRPEGFGKSMNLSMLRAFLERPAVGRSGQRLFADAQIWDANGGRYRDEYACYPVISLDFSGAGRRGPAVAGVVRDALSGECARLLALLEAPDLARDKVRHIERVARGVASADEVDSVLGVLIELLEIACDEQVVLLVDGYDAAWSRRASARDASDADPAELLDRALFDAIATARDSLRLTCLMGECPGPAEAALSLHCCSYCLTTPLSTWCDRWFGFSDAEAEALLNHAGREEYLDDAREWLEGYRFGRAYCSSPERVIGFLDRGCTAPVRADLYGYADCLSRVVAGWNLDRLSVLFDLLEAHGCVEVPLCLGTAEPDVSPDDSMWTALYLSGFLTTDMTEEPEHGDRLRALRLPNKELRQALRLVIVEWFECAAEDIRDVDAFRDGLCRGNEDTVRRALSRILGDAGIGETDPDKPLPYHLLLQGLCFGLPGYANPASRRKCGADRWDIQVFPTGAVFDIADTIGMLDERPLITINMMYDPGVDALGLELLAVQALLDIERDGIDEIRVPRPAIGRMRWGFGFDGQRVSVVCQRL
ncbi:AAA family ATPase [Collinsella aerofaciens]|uniref:AAA family ATPase n=1 Tax=Collinsella aerofaciens TaxID=74426 RepID=UPI0023303084|nr:AAA family ATPase [Collinsella aerofaciens]MDB1856024.1 AAA family ATPase [Collinsella aerofaciens]